MWAGHYEPAFMAASLAAFTAGDLTRHRYPALTVFADLTVLAWLAATIAGMRWHEPGLCERCAAATPLDPQAAVTRWKPALRLAHSRWFRAAAVATVLAWDLAGSVTMSVNGRHVFGMPGGPWYYAAVLLLGIPAYALLASVVLTGRKHRQLYPWCPYCNWDDGGEEETIPEPDPEDDGVPSPAG